MVIDERFRIIDQYFCCHSAEPQENAFHPLEPICLALSQRYRRVQTTRITQRPDEPVNANPSAADSHVRVPKVDLLLMTWSRLKADCRRFCAFNSHRH